MAISFPQQSVNLTTSGKCAVIWLRSHVTSTLSGAASCPSPSNDSSWYTWRVSKNCSISCWRTVLAHSAVAASILLVIDSSNNVMRSVVSVIQSSIRWFNAESAWSVNSLLWSTFCSRSANLVSSANLTASKLAQVASAVPTWIGCPSQSVKAWSITPSIKGLRSSVKFSPSAKWRISVLPS